MTAPTSQEWRAALAEAARLDEDDLSGDAMEFITPLIRRAETAAQERVVKGLEEWDDHTDPVVAMALTVAREAVGT